MSADITRYLTQKEIGHSLARGLSLYVKDTGTIKGRGVFAGRPFSRGEIVEIAPVIVFTSECKLPRSLANALYNWEEQTHEPKTRAIALGYGSLYNHNNPSNLGYRVDSRARVIRYTALRDIAVDEELTINYSAAGGYCEAKADNWFERHGVARWSADSVSGPGTASGPA